MKKPLKKAAKKPMPSKGGKSGNDYSLGKMGGGKVKDRGCK